MLWPDAEATIRAHVEALWALSDFREIPLVWENEVAPYNASYLLVTVEGVLGQKTIFGTTGNRMSIEHGLVFYHAFVPVSTGKQAALRPVAAMQAMLELQSISTGLNFAGANPPSPVQRGETDDPLITADQPSGVYYRCSGSVPFILINAV